MYTNRRPKLLRRDKWNPHFRKLAQHSHGNPSSFAWPNNSLNIYFSRRRVIVQRCDTAYKGLRRRLARLAKNSLSDFEVISLVRSFLGSTESAPRTKSLRSGGQIIQIRIWVVRRSRQTRAALCVLPIRDVVSWNKDACLHPDET
jgi:hypothetical protein